MADPRPKPWADRVQLAIDWARVNAAAAVRQQGGQLDEQGALAFPDATPSEARELVHVAVRYEAVRDELATAEAFLGRNGTFATWVDGSRVEGSWAHTQAAYAHLVCVLTADQLDGYAPRALSSIRTYLGRDQPERIAVQGWSERLRLPPSRRGNVTDGEREALAAALRASNERNASEFQRLRRFRNLLGLATLLVTLLVGGLVWLGSVEPQLVPLCFTGPEPTEGTAGGATGSTTAGATATVCPTGERDRATGGDVGTVVLFGLAGSAITVVRALARRAPPTLVPLATVRTFQAVLKLTLGMLSALLGLLFLRAGVVPGFSALDTQSEIIAYAVVFGAAQDLLTRVIDDRSNTLIENVELVDPTSAARRGAGVSGTPTGEAVVDEADDGPGRGGSA